MLSYTNRYRITLNEALSYTEQGGVRHGDHRPQDTPQDSGEEEQGRQAQAAAPRPSQTTRRTGHHRVHPLKQRHGRKHPHPGRDGDRHPGNDRGRKNHTRDTGSTKPPGRHPVPQTDSPGQHQDNPRNHTADTQTPPGQDTGTPRRVPHRHDKGPGGTLHPTEEHRDTTAHPATHRLAPQEPHGAHPRGAGGQVHARAPRHPPLPRRQRKNRPDTHEHHPHAARIPRTHQHQHPRQETVPEGPPRGRPRQPPAPRQLHSHQRRGGPHQTPRRHRGTRNHQPTRSGAAQPLHRGVPGATSI